MKKTVALLLAVMMAFGLCACGNSAKTGTSYAEQSAIVTDEVQTGAEEDAESGEYSEKDPVVPVSFEPLGYDFGFVYVEVVGAEAFTGCDGKDAVRFYYDFTNTSPTLQSAWWNLNLSAEQAGFELTSTCADWGEEAEEADNDSLDIYPGVTVRCIYECTYNPSAGGVVTLNVDYNYDDVFSVDFDATNLPGVLKEAPEYEFIDDPDLTAGLPTEAECEEYKLVLNGDYEYAEDYDGNTVLLVNFDFTNNDSEATDAWMETNIHAFQDGIQLQTGYPVSVIEAYENYYKDIETGETINCSVPFILRTTSPVEVYSEVNYYDDIIIGELLAFDLD